MKRFLSIFLFVALTAATLSGCGEDADVSQEDPSFPSADPIEKLEWPEKYKGEIKAVICIKKVTDQIQY